MARASNIEQILQRQAAFWEVRRRLDEEGTLAHLVEGPWISISKQTGSGGVDLARRLAEGLGWQTYDREILSEISRNTDRREAILSRLDEKTVGAFGDYIAQVFVPEVIGRTAFLKELAHVIWGLGRQGHAVIVGRGANWILDARFGLRVRVVAPMEQRIDAVARELELSQSNAASHIVNVDGEQANFIRQSVGRDIEDPLGYDLVVNTGSMDAETATRVVIAALRAKLDRPA